MSFLLFYKSFLFLFFFSVLFLYWFGIEVLWSSFFKVVYDYSTWNIIIIKKTDVKLKNERIKKNRVMKAYKYDTKYLTKEE